MENKEPSRGVKFMDTKYSPVKFLTVDDDRNYKQGDLVFVGGESKVYGPYQLDLQIGQGNGQVHWKAFSVNSRAQQKPMTKDELEQQNAQLLARIEELAAQVNAAKPKQPKAAASTKA